VEQTTKYLNDNAITSGLNSIENADQNINLNGYLPNTDKKLSNKEETTGMIDYMTAYDELKK
jgi:hypothetical protein